MEPFLSELSVFENLPQTSSWPPLYTYRLWFQRCSFWCPRKIWLEHVLFWKSQVVFKYPFDRALMQPNISHLAVAEGHVRCIWITCFCHSDGCRCFRVRRFWNGEATLPESNIAPENRLSQKETRIPHLLTSMTMYSPRLKVDGAAPGKYSVVRGYGKPKHGSRAIYNILGGTDGDNFIRWSFGRCFYHGGFAWFCSYPERGYVKVILKPQWIFHGIPSPIYPLNKHTFHIFHDLAYCTFSCLVSCSIMFLCFSMAYPCHPHTEAVSEHLPFGERVM